MTTQQKIQTASEMLPRSAGFRANLNLSSEQWAGILSKLDEKKIDELMLILNEEKDMNGEVIKEKERKLAVNHSKYLQRLEKLKLRAESLQYNAPNNA